MEPDPIVHNPPSRRLNNRRHHQWNFMNTHFQIHNDGRAADDTTFGDRAWGVLNLTQQLGPADHLVHRNLKHNCGTCQTGVSKNLTKNCTWTAPADSPQGPDQATSR